MSKSIQFFVPPLRPNPRFTFDGVLIGRLGVGYWSLDGKISFEVKHKTIVRRSNNNNNNHIVSWQVHMARLM